MHVLQERHVARLEAEALTVAPARRVETIELAGPTKRHHNNTLRARESIPVRVTLAPWTDGTARVRNERGFPLIGKS